MKYYLNYISVKKGSLILAGGMKAEKTLNSIEVMSLDSPSRMQLPKFPIQISQCSLFLKNGILMVWGGRKRNYDMNEDCFQLKNGSWQIYKDLKTQGHCTSNCMVMTKEATYVFGADKRCSKVILLQNDSKKWKIEKRFQIPGQFAHSCAIEVKSKGEIWVIGGVNDAAKRILRFDLQNRTYEESSMTLIIGRYIPKCIVTKIGNTEVILVTGGKVEGGDFQNSVEIINIEDGTVTLSSPMNFKRGSHGIGTLRYKNQNRIAIFGGSNESTNENTIEVFDPETLKWELVVDIKMNESKYNFGYLTI